MSFFALALAAAVIAPKPLTPPATWISPDDYPKAALEADKEGTVRVTLAVGTDGTVGSCTVASSSGHIELDSITCELIKLRARFNPAVDADGSPTLGNYSLSFAWRTPRDELADQGVLIEYAIDSNGRMGGCELKWIGSDQDEGITCERFRSEDAFSIILKSSLSKFTSVQFRILGLVNDSKPLGIDVYDERVIIAASTFSVSAAGIMTDCTVEVSSSFGGEAIDLCTDTFPLGSREYAADPEGKSSRLRVSFEMAAKRRR